MGGKKNLKIQTVIGHAREHLENGNKIGALESVRKDTDYSLAEAKTLVKFIELFTILENNATVASHWCQEHRVARFKCVGQHSKSTGMRSFIHGADANRDYRAEAKTLAEFTRSVGSFCGEHLAPRSECARLHPQVEPPFPQSKPGEVRSTTPVSVPRCACGNVSCDNQWHSLAMWINDHPFEWQRALEELSSVPPQNSERAKSLPD